MIIVGGGTIIRLSVGFFRDPTAQGQLSLREKTILSLTGFFSYILDTIGIGSYAIIIGLNHVYKMIASRSLPGTLTAHGILPALIQAIFFMRVVEIDPWTLTVLLLAVTAGAFWGSSMVVRLNSRRVETSMCFAYFCMGVLVLIDQLGWLPFGGEGHGLSGYKLVFGFLGMFVIGFLPALGVGAYAPTQMFLFVLGLAPIVAFPVMCSAGVIQQAIVASRFSSSGLVESKKALVLALSGALGTLLAIPFVSSLSSQTLRWVLLGVIIYNILMILRSLRSQTPEESVHPEITPHCDVV